MVSQLRFSFFLIQLSTAAADIAPKLGDGSSVDWWFAFKLNTYAFKSCSTTRKCIFGGEVQDYPYGYGLQYLEASHSNGATKEMELKTDCLGTGDDPVAKTFDQIYSGTAPNYVIWNDQLYQEPIMNLTPPCSSWGNADSCSAPWGHSKGALAWDKDGNGFIMQVTTPDWPGNGNSNITRKVQGNSLGCNTDDNVMVSQHFFSLKLMHSDITAILTAMQKAMVVTDPNSSQLVKLTTGPSDLASLAKGLGKANTDKTVFQATLSTGAKLIAKPQALKVPVWQMVSALVEKPLRTATWWTAPAVLSAKAGKPGCWSDELGTPEEVQIATTGQWKGTKFNLTGGLGTDFNHAKLGYSLEGSLAIMGDMNQQGSYSPSDQRAGCSSSQNARGGMFFVLDDATLNSGLKELMTGETADYHGSTPSPSPPSPGPSPPSPGPTSNCSGAKGTWQSCTGAGCTYVHAANEIQCGVSGYGCYQTSSLKAGCPDKKGDHFLV